MVNIDENVGICAFPKYGFLCLAFVKIINFIEAAIYIARDGASKKCAEKHVDAMKVQNCSSEASTRELSELATNENLVIRNAKTVLPSLSNTIQRQKKSYVCVCARIPIV